MVEDTQGELSQVTDNSELEHKPRVFFGAAMQGGRDRSERAGVYAEIMACIDGLGYEVVFDHTRGRSREEVQEILQNKFPNIPPDGTERKQFVRSEIVDELEGNIDAAVFEVSTPSLGTGIEIGEVALRPRMKRRGTNEAIPAIPILLLYQRGYWINGLSTMIEGISPNEFPNITIGYYDTLDEAKQITTEFLKRNVPTSA